MFIFRVANPDGVRCCGFLGLLEFIGLLELLEIVGSTSVRGLRLDADSRCFGKGDHLETGLFGKTISTGVFPLICNRIVLQKFRWFPEFPAVIIYIVPKLRIWLSNLPTVLNWAVL